MLTDIHPVGSLMLLGEIRCCPIMSMTFKALWPALDPPDFTMLIVKLHQICLRSLPQEYQLHPHSNYRHWPN